MAETGSNIYDKQEQRYIETLLYTNAPSATLARRGRVSAIVILSLLLLAIPVFVVQLMAVITNPMDVPALGFWVSIPLVILLIGIYFVNRAGRIPLAGLLLALLLVAFDFIFLYAISQALMAAIVLLVAVMIAGLLGPPISALFVALLSGIGFVTINLLNNPAYFTNAEQGDTFSVVFVFANLIAAALISFLFARTTIGALEESEEYSLVLSTQAEEIERRLVEQTRQLQATVTVARAVAGTRDLDQLLQDVVELVRTTFGYYHVQVFMVDEDVQYAILQQSTGEVGRKLLERGHRLPVGSLSVIGQVTSGGRPVVAHDTDASPVHRRNELLPNTRSEMAIPLIVGEKIIGALDLQSVEPEAFTPDVIPTLQALADQVAVAIENARLFEQAEVNLRELSELSRDVTQRSWAEFLADTHEDQRRQVIGTEPKALQVHRSRVVERVLNMGSVIVASGADGEQAYIAAPIVVRNEVVGVLGVEPDGDREWAQGELQLLQGIAERTALAVENARLYIQAQRAVEREQMINTIATRLQRAPSLAMLLESAAQELADALGTDNVYAELSLETPLAHKRKQVTETDQVDSSEKQNDLATPDETEEAKAEL